MKLQSKLLAIRHPRAIAIFAGTGVVGFVLLLYIFGGVFPSVEPDPAQRAVGANQAETRQQNNL